MDDVRPQLESLHAESFGWALCCCGRDLLRAQDVLQQAYLKVLNGKARFAGAGVFKTWLFAVIRMTARDDARQNWLRLRALERFTRRASQNTVTAPGGEGMDRSAECEALLKSLERLPARQKELLHLVFYQQFSIAEAAGVMSISLGAARTHYERGKAAIRVALAREKIFLETIDHERLSGRSTIAGALL